MARTTEIYIRLLHEGTECSRPTQALDLGNGLFKVLPISNYDAEDGFGSFLRIQSCARRSGGVRERNFCWPSPANLS